jgi:hypothetical protein
MLMAEQNGHASEALVASEVVVASTAETWARTKEGADKKMATTANT